MGVFFEYLTKDKEQVFNSDFGHYLEKVIQEEKKVIGNILIILTSNEHLLEINKNFLDHSYYTDVITFSNNKRNTLNGDIFISADQVMLNAEIYKVSFKRELQRVAIHGILHLVGYNDQTEDEKRTMKMLEDKYLCGFK